MNTTHTPGPWQVSPYGNITSKSGKIASVEQMPGNYESEKQANAHLIAACPDLLEALQWMVEAHESGLLVCRGGTQGDKTFHAKRLEYAISAIAKAKGLNTQSCNT